MPSQKKKYYQEKTKFIGKKNAAALVASSACKSNCTVLFLEAIIILWHVMGKFLYDFSLYHA